MKMPHILFFIQGTAPTKSESEAALEIGMVAMRNRSVISPTDNPERCDAVAGEVIPTQYASKPVVKTLADAIKIVREKQRAESAAAAASLANRKSVASVQADGKASGKAETPGASGSAKEEKPGSGAGWTKNA